MIARYNVTNPFQSKEIMDQIDKEALYRRINEIKRQHNTFHTSSQENHFYVELIHIFGKDDIIRSYSSELYPFLCDFYVKSLDLYIELNLHWTHGKHWFNNLDSNDLNTLEKWIEKAKISKYYKQAIDTWTVRDVKKRQFAISNNLNYIVLWNINDITYFLTQYNCMNKATIW